MDFPDFTAMAGKIEMHPPKAVCELTAYSSWRLVLAWIIDHRCTIEPHLSSHQLGQADSFSVTAKSDLG